MSPDIDITQILSRLKSGDAEAEDVLIPCIYPELRRRAALCLRNERPNHTLQPTALVNEVYMRLLGPRKVDWQSRSHFFAVASRVMRRILVDHAREHRSEKRGGGAPILELTDIGALTDEQFDLVLAVHEALLRLSALDERQAQIVEMKFFGGLTEAEIALVLGVSDRTVKRDWAMARAWLHSELKPIS
jgi:RNA polymerase sigma factor (TIGR02999 family)